MTHKVIYTISILILAKSIIFSQPPVLYDDSYRHNSVIPSPSNLFIWKNELYMERLIGDQYNFRNNLWKFDSNQNASMLAQAGILKVVTSNDYMMLHCSFPTNNGALTVAFTKTGNPNDFTISSLNRTLYYAMAKNDTFYVNITDNNNVLKLWRVVPSENGLQETMLSVPNNLWIEKHMIYKNDIYFVAVFYNSSSNTRYLYRIRNNQVQFVRSYVNDFHILGDEIFISSNSGFLYYLQKGTISNNGQITWKTLSYYNPYQNEYMGFIHDFITFKNKVFFSGSLQYVGEQLCYVSNDSIKVVTNEDYTSNTLNILGQVNDKIIFEYRKAEQDVGRLYLWSSDGTTQGTSIISRDVYFSGSGYPDSYTGGERRPAVFQNRIFFSGTTMNEGEEVWFTDGTAAGTKMLIDINPGTANSKPTDFIAFNNRLYFVANHPTYGGELWYFEPNCLSAKSLSGISTQDEGSLDYLNSTQKVLNNVTRQYKASKAFTLNPGFEVEQGAVFRTIFDYGCQY